MDNYKTKHLSIDKTMVYLYSAKSLHEDTFFPYCCSHINKNSLNLSDFRDNKFIIAFAEYFRETTGSYWMNCKDLNEEENKELRVMALLFMQEIYNDFWRENG